MLLGTPLGDPLEMGAFSAVFRTEDFYVLPVCIGASKSRFGHAETASGSISLDQMMFRLKNMKESPNLHIRQMNNIVSNIIDRHYLADGRTLSIPRQSFGNTTYGFALFGGISAFAFQGTNAHAVICMTEAELDDICIVETVWGKGYSWMTPNMTHHIISSLVKKDEIVTFMVRPGFLCNSMTINQTKYIPSGVLLHLHSQSESLLNQDDEKCDFSDFTISSKVFADVETDFFVDMDMSKAQQEAYVYENGCERSYISQLSMFYTLNDMKEGDFSQLYPSHSTVIERKGPMPSRMANCTRQSDMDNDYSHYISSVWESMLQLSLKGNGRLSSSKYIAIDSPSDNSSIYAYPSRAGLVEHRCCVVDPKSSSSRKKPTRVRCHLYQIQHYISNQYDHINRDEHRVMKYNDFILRDISPYSNVIAIHSTHGKILFLSPASH